MIDQYERLIGDSNDLSPPCFFSPSSVHPPPRKEGGQEGACERADLSAVPLDATGQGHHGGVFAGLESLVDLSGLNLTCRPHCSCGYFFYLKQTYIVDQKTDKLVILSRFVYFYLTYIHNDLGQHVFFSSLVIIDYI